MGGAFARRVGEHVVVGRRVRSRTFASVNSTHAHGAGRLRCTTWIGNPALSTPPNPPHTSTPPSPIMRQGVGPYLITKLCASISGPQPLLSRTPELPTMAQVGNCLPLRGEVRGSSSYRFCETFMVLSLSKT